jgi:hypothetical protein
MASCRHFKARSLFEPEVCRYWKDRNPHYPGYCKHPRSWCARRKAEDLPSGPTTTTMATRIELFLEKSLSYNNGNPILQ